MPGVLSRNYGIDKGINSGLTSVYNPATGQWDNPAAKPTDPIENAYKLKDSAIKTQAGDYDSIMNNYKQLLANTSSIPMMQPSTYQPQTYQYQTSPDLKGALGNLQQLSQTGGYTNEGIADLRERGISPIRAIYANAQRDIDRNRRLQGGFSPNYNAVKAKMAREMSDRIGSAVRDVNAGLAQNVAQNKLSVAPQYANVAAQQSNLQNEIGERNTGIMNDASKFNMQFPLEVNKYNVGLQSQVADVLRSMQGLYGTTPALAQLFGQQALSSAGLQNQINQQNTNSGIDFLRSVMGRA